ncbi:hypothetical protein ACWGJB_45350 [Streptomyces sp. NPDC054813]
MAVRFVDDSAVAVVSVDLFAVSPGHRIERAGGGGGRTTSAAAAFS